VPKVYDDEWANEKANGWLRGQRLDAAITLRSSVKQEKLGDRGRVIRLAAPHDLPAGAVASVEATRHVGDRQRIGEADDLADRRPPVPSADLAERIARYAACRRAQPVIMVWRRSNLSAFSVAPMPTASR
jgi:hypothetical protein